MRTCYFYSQQHPEAMKALELYAPDAELADTSGSDYAYWKTLRERWTGEDDLLIIEQDIEIHEGVIESLAACSEDWCSYAYPIFRRQIKLRVGLGCTRISAAAQRKISARQVAEGFALCKNCRGQGCWWHLDARISELLKQNGLNPHVHGDVIHHHDYGQEVWASHGGLEEEEGVIRGVPIEWHFEDPQGDDYPAVQLDIGWAAQETYALSPRHALAVAANLQRMGLEHGLLPPVSEWSPIAAAPEQNGHQDSTSRGPTDKIAHGYMPAYRRIAEQLGPAARVCEIGVYRGASLDVWRDLFPQATIAGIDNDMNARWPQGTIRIVASQDSPDLPSLLYAHEEQWDLIVDDASHDGVLTAATLGLLWPLVSPGGYYVIEDWYVGYDTWLRYDKSMLNLAQALLMRLDAGSDTESIDYRYGMAILRKKFGGV